MEIRSKNPLGKNNFDKLAAAGLVAGVDDSENMKAKTEARVHEIKSLITKVQKVETHLSILATLEKPRQLKRLASAAIVLRDLHATRLPVGAKKHIEACLNEVISLKEGVFASNSRLDQNVLALTASARARTELEAMVESAEHRLQRVVADSTDDMDMEEFYRKVKDVLQRSNAESTKIAPLANKPFIFARVPVIPIDTAISVEKLPRLGFKADSIGSNPSYPVIHNQLVLGINPAYLGTKDDAVTDTVNDVAKKIKEAGFDLDDIKKSVNNLKRVNSELEDIERDKKAGRKVDADRVAILTKAVSRYTEKIDKFKKEVGDPDEIARMGNAVKRRHNKTPGDVKEEAERLRKLLEKKLKVKLRFVSEQPFSKKGGFWFWLMPDRELDMLAKASHTKAVKVTRWGFAFD